MRIVSIFVVLAVAACAADSPTTCPQSISDYCATTSLPCPRSIGQAEDTAAWGGCANRNTNDSPLIEYTCGDVTVFEMWGVDASTNYTYDTSSGALIAITGHQAIRAADVCVAGTAPTTGCSLAERDLCP